MLKKHDLVRRSKAAIASLMAVGFTDAAAIPAGLWFAAYLGSLPGDAVVADLELVPSEAAYAVVGLVQTAAPVFAAVFFIRWFYMAHQNLSQLDGSPTKYASSWTIWGFFVPFLNLVRPQQVMREVWERTNRLWDEKPLQVAGLVRPADRVNQWWGLFLATNAVGSVVGRISLRATTAEASLQAAWLTLLADLFDILAVAVAVVLVRNVTDLQHPLLRHTPKDSFG